ncbi:hypothetical protein [Sphingomonas jinjuensis]|uniref:hypothetical protein n=1 Tax=Sphingomonas jinjuensis TaxID=535907 RepID=UPI001C842E1A|nr:hypothetical protein [Sphingomonas jinjuensis]
MPIGGALLLVLAAKLYLIAIAGNPTPFWDQWGGEAIDLFIPYVDGRLTLADLISPHNEHRIFFTRLWALLVLELAGNWNVLAEMIANALLHLGVLVLLAWLLRSLMAQAPWLMALFLILLFAVPFGIENTLWGFQSQFYFVLLLSVPALALLASAAALSARWMVGLALAMAAYFAMASGALTPIGAAAVPIVQMLIGARRRTPREVAGVAMLIGTTILAIAVTTLPPDTGHSRAQDIGQWLSAFSRAAGWPLRGIIVAPIVLNAPVLLLLWRLVRDKVEPRDAAWRLIAIAAWLALQCASLAYGRAAAAVMSRYLDLLALGVIVNAAALVRLSADAAAGRAQVAATAGWTAIVAALLALSAAVTLPRFYLLDRAAAQSRTEALSLFIRTDDVRAFVRPMFWAPTPFPERLAAIVRRPEIAGLLPDQFGVSPAVRSATRQRLALHGGLGLSPATTARLALYAAAALFAAVAALWAAAASLRLVYPPRP